MNKQILVQSEFDIQFTLPAPAPIVALLHLHPSLEPRLISGNNLHVESLGIPLPPNQVVATSEYMDSFGNRCTRFLAPAGHIRLSGSNVTELDPTANLARPDATQAPVGELASEVLQFLLPSRYCQVDLFGSMAFDLFGGTSPGWSRAVAIRDWVHNRVAFDYNAARPTKTAMDVVTEQVGVCRDFQHLAITLTRCMNIPARYVTGYLGDIRRPFGGRGDFSAWYQVYLGGEWIDFDARHNDLRLGRILMATGRDAADVAITTSFGTANLVKFYVESNEVDAGGNKVPLPANELTTEMGDIGERGSNGPTQTNRRGSSPAQIQSATS